MHADHAKSWHAQIGRRHRYHHLLAVPHCLRVRLGAAAVHLRDDRRLAAVAVVAREELNVLKVKIGTIGFFLVPPVRCMPLSRALCDCCR